MGQKVINVRSFALLVLLVLVLVAHLAFTSPAGVPLNADNVEISDD